MGRIEPTFSEKTSHVRALDPELRQQFRVDRFPIGFIEAIAKAGVSMQQRLGAQLDFAERRLWPCLGYRTHLYVAAVVKDRSVA